MLEIDLNDKGRFSVLDEKFHLVRFLTMTAKDSVKDLREDLPQKFTLRGSWVSMGLRFDPATMENPEARVYSLDDYMFKQEEGETYRPEGHVAIPWGARPNKNRPIPSQLLPRALRGRRDIFKFDYSKSNSYKPYPLSGLFQRHPQGKKIVVSYLLKKTKVTRSRWGFREKVERSIERNLDAHYFKND
jgi:hypothetical protein